MLKVQTIQEQVTPSPFTFGIPPANSCVVDNFTVSYLYIQDAGVYVPPNSTRTVGLPAPQSTVTVLWQAPPGVAVPTPGSGNAIIIWSDQVAQTTQASFYPNVGATPVTITGQPITIAGQITPSLEGALQTGNGMPPGFTAVNGHASADNTTVVALPGGHIFALLVVGVSGTSVSTATSAPSVSDAGGTIYAECAVAQNAAGTTGANNTAVNPRVIIGLAFAVTLTLHFGGAGSAVAWAHGYYV